jgi:hypothetical protein
MAFDGGKNEFKPNLVLEMPKPYFGTCANVDSNDSDRWNQHHTCYTFLFCATPSGFFLGCETLLFSPHTTSAITALSEDKPELHICPIRAQSIGDGCHIHDMIKVPQKLLSKACCASFLDTYNQNSAKLLSQNAKL